MERFSTFKLMTRYLEKMCTNTQIGLSTNKNWWVFGAFFCRKFLNQATSLELLLIRPLDNSDLSSQANVFDISSIWTLIRSLYETHATYYHLFMPCDNIEENILRFRLWELDSTKSLLKFKRQYIHAEVNGKMQWLTENEQRCINAIKSLSLFNELPEKSKNSLIERPNWRMVFPNSSQRLSYDSLIKNTKIEDTHFQDMYEYTSMHVHPAYAGIRQNLGLTEEEIEEMKYTAIMQICFVTSFFIMDFQSRYAEAKEQYACIIPDHKKIIESFESMGRKR